MNKNNINPLITDLAAFSALLLSVGNGELLKRYERRKEFKERLAKAIPFEKVVEITGGGWTGADKALKSAIVSSEAIDEPLSEAVKVNIQTNMWKPKEHAVLSEAFTVKQLKDLAEAYNVDLTGAKKKKDIWKKLTENFQNFVDLCQAYDKIFDKTSLERNK